MTQDEIIEMVMQIGGCDRPEDDSPALKMFVTFAKLVAAKEREKWKEIVEDQRLRLQVLNEIIGGEDSTTTGNILSYSRWEMRLEDAVKEEREALEAELLKLKKGIASNSDYIQGRWDLIGEFQDVIRARGQE